MSLCGGVLASATVWGGYLLVPLCGGVLASVTVWWGTCYCVGGYLLLTLANLLY